MSRNARLIYSPDYTTYYFNDDHPFNQRRLLLMHDLMSSYGLLAESDIIAPRMATDEELALVHDARYIQFVRDQGHSEKELPQAASYGLGTEDVPCFQNMHESAALIVGGTLNAVDAVMKGQAEHAFNPAGGLHHAFRGRASGFCIYNDCSVAIAYLRKHWNARVMYIDTDAHHGDGVQWAFYDDPNVLTVSIHETGKYLFPGTGNLSERGDGSGYGFSVNVPLDAFTEDDSFLEVYGELVSKLARGFKPDVILTQNGCDAHTFDPLTHLSCSMRIYQDIPRLAHRLAHELCDGRWIAVGGGGYDIWRVVPRAWTLVWSEMSDQPLEDGDLPSGWLKRWQPQTDLPLPTRLFDEPFPAIPRRAEITEKNRITLERAMMYAPTEASK
ncbi:MULTISPECIES: acetoin utilization protein AcuC [Brevibacillus]|uniref:acetoin utilization protein AcuC n=1 Tax=Brevibacillus TaxID=55080 RepID=UPI00156AAB49|nr:MULTISPECIES: acetoin utilization protein AcuC [Brevibacillus]MBU8714348.1 acetoin utilization protein AcuC [Brevibacillus parabrevis]MDH6351433.1 acetoin utilization protein AcuC [Brevibacillus sp. 1238]MDR4998809.1 acetoin utilization protein AcuC [Brevibacillus parabrevis]MED1723666.1 acetoin utilization protein AcuC [Brevibacillus parabrevis]MED2254943.1 acetoin utilization protein AcuC [Brevibacillus parabrevis]